MSDEQRESAASVLAGVHVAVIGVGGLGCPAAAALARSGVGRITLVDPDRVELSNLPRQLLYGEADLGHPKVESAAAHLRRLHPVLEVQTRHEALQRDNAEQILAATDLVIDATDGSEVKFLINDVATDLGIPFCHAGVLGWGGQALLVVPGATPCLRCLFAGGDERSDLPTCGRAGIVGPIAGLFGALQASLGTAYLLGDDGAAGRLIGYDRRSDRWRDLDVTGAPRCAACARRSTASLDRRPRPQSQGDESTWAT